MTFSVQPLDVASPSQIPQTPPDVVGEKSLSILQLIKKDIAVGWKWIELQCVCMSRRPVVDDHHL